MRLIDLSSPVSAGSWEPDPVTHEVLDPRAGALHMAAEMREHFGVGFELQTERMRLGPVPGAFGHGGAGGSCHGAWPEQGIGFSYAMSRLRDDHDVDPRSKALLGALHRAVTE